MAYTTIDDPSAHFQSFTYTGNGADRTITLPGNSDLKFDMYWYKQRNNTQHHRLFDTSRGLSLELYPDLSAADSAATYFNNQQANSFDIIAHDSATNTGSAIFANWQWKANGGTRTTFSESGDNPGGGYQVNTTGGLSIVDYTGTQAIGTVAHGLGAVPKMIIVKDRDATRNWCVYHNKMGADANDNVMHINTTAAFVDYGNQYWGDTTPTSSVFTLGNAHDINYNDRKYIAYCFADVQGYSKFSSYVSNAVVDGPFVYTGFKPALVMIKNINRAEPWMMYDTKVTPTNPMNTVIHANSNSAVSTAAGDYQADFLSNGFKIRVAATGYANHTVSNTYIYMAFAEEPLVTSTGVPATAR